MVAVKRTWCCTDYDEPWSKENYEKLAAYDYDDTLFSYKAHLLQTYGCFPILCSCTLNRIFSRELHLQSLFMLLIASTFGLICYFSGANDKILGMCEEYDWNCYRSNSVLAFSISGFRENVSGLARYVGGLFLSLSLARTYYANRGLLGTVFAETLGLSMMTASSLKPLPGNPEKHVENAREMCANDVQSWVLKLGLSSETSNILLQNDIDGKTILTWNENFLSMLLGMGISPKDASLLLHEIEELKNSVKSAESMDEVKHFREEIVRLVNAGFRLLWLEHTGQDSDIADEDYSALDGMLTPAEWKHIDGIPSRATYVYSWIGDIIWQAREKGYIRTEQEAVRMHEFVERLRGANVWGLPSLPYPYVVWIVIIIKASLFLYAFNAGAVVSVLISLGQGDGGFTMDLKWGIGICVLDVLFSNFMWQGMLDLHAMLRNPNQGVLVGHMPTKIFLTFTKDVCENCIDLLDKAPHVNNGKSLRFTGDEKDMGGSKMDDEYEIPKQNMMMGVVELESRKKDPAAQ